MPLPPALAARLEKRGLLNAAQQKKDKSEEVIAEDDGDRKRRALLAAKAADIVEIAPIMGYPGCPNKYNIYHECGAYCNIYWGNGILEPDKSYLKKKKKMLNKYPLPEHWREEYDPGTGRFFYWDQQTNMVSWLPPMHPKAQVSEAASILREKVKPIINSKVEEDTSGVDRDESGSEDSDMSNSEEDEGSTMQLSELQSRLSRERSRQMMDRRGGRLVKKDNDLDPMDPAAYSDTPRGTWATGLGQMDEAKTGVDTTASGPLFQQRPYPSPGAVLRANANKN
ncbi:hypothetical protein B566_EDAN015628 [Ephemera danica]|nr:hypothetical protein B566_EDAN015628 [Ephemera danica]